MSSAPPAVLVAGGTGPIGSAVAAVLAERGHRVALHYRSAAPRAAAVVEDLAGSGHVTVGADLLDIDGAARLVTDAEARLGEPIGALVNCAWPAHRSVPLGDPDGAMLLDPALDGVRAHVALCRAVLPSLRRAGGAIVFVGGALAHRLHPGLGYYSLGKAAATTATLTLALEEGPHRVRANVIAPGRVDVGAGDLAETDPYYASLDQVGAVRRALPSLPTVAEVARIAAFLVGPDATGVTGQVLAVAGGEPV